MHADMHVISVMCFQLFG